MRTMKREKGPDPKRAGDRAVHRALQQEGHSVVGHVYSGVRQRFNDVLGVPWDKSACVGGDR